MSNLDDAETRAFLQEFQEQPEDVRRVFLYVICQTMVQAGLLESLGVFRTPGLGTTLLYRNPQTHEIFEIVKPDVSDEEAQDLKLHIRELLQEQARAS